MYYLRCAANAKEIEAQLQSAKVFRMSGPKRATFPGHYAVRGLNKREIQSEKKSAPHDDEMARASGDLVEVSPRATLRTPRAAFVRHSPKRRSQCQAHQGFSRKDSQKGQEFSMTRAGADLLQSCGGCVGETEGSRETLQMQSGCTSSELSHFRSSVAQIAFWREKQTVSKINFE